MLPLKEKDKPLVQKLLAAGSCPRCVLRFCCLAVQAAYRQPEQVSPQPLPLQRGLTLTSAPPTPRKHSRSFKLLLRKQSKILLSPQRRTAPMMPQARSRPRNEPNSSVLPQRKMLQLCTRCRRKSRGCVWCVWVSYRSSVTSPNQQRCVCVCGRGWAELEVVLTVCSCLADSSSSQGPAVRV